MTDQKQDSPENRLKITDNAVPMKGMQLTAHTAIMTLLDDPAANELLARFIETAQGLDEECAKDETTSAASYWTVDAYAPGAGRYQLSITRLNRESPHDKAVRFRDVLRRIASIASRYDSPEHALEVVMGMAKEAVRGEME